MAEGGVEIVAPQQADHPAAEPDAFRVAGRAGEQAGGLGDLVDAFLAFLGGVGGRFLLVRRLAALPLWASAGLAAILRAATQNAARNTRNERLIGIVSPVC